MTPNRKPFAMVVAALLVTSVFIPGLAAAASAIAGNTSLTVSTGDAANVTDTSVELNGALNDLGGAENATVSLAYYEQADENASEAEAVAETEFDEPGPFGAEVTDLEPNTTYVYVARVTANGTTERGAYEGSTTAQATLDVETDEAEDVTNSSATLSGELTGLGEADAANVSFQYWAEGDAANATIVEAGELNASEEFSAAVSGLENDTTYVYVARAETGDDTAEGAEASFTPGVTEASEEFEMTEGPFGQNVARFVSYLRSSADTAERNLGQAVSEFARANNPGADNRPDHAGPDGEAEEDGEDDERRGPTEDEERGPKDKDEDDERRGPPTDGEGSETQAVEEEDADDEDEREETDEDGDGDEDENERGPPEGKGYNK